MRSLAKASNLDEFDYLVSIHETVRQVGFTLYSEQVLGVDPTCRLLLAPTIRVDEVVAVSNLMSPDDTEFQRIPVGSELVALNEIFPFLLLVCGREGVTGLFQEIPDNTTNLARRLLEICPHYGNDLQAGHGKPWEKTDDLTAVQRDLEDSHCFHFSWD